MIWLTRCVKWRCVLEGCRKISKLIVLIHKRETGVNEPTTAASLWWASQEACRLRCRENNWTKAGCYPVWFCRSRSATEQISTLQKNFKKFWEHAKDFYTCFVDLGKVYGRVPHENLWVMLREYGVDGRLLLAVKSLYSCSEDCVPLDGVKSQPFSVGLRQWCVLSPLLFIVYIRVLHTTARRSNSTYEAISSGRKTHFANNEKVIYLQKMCWLGRMEHIPKKLVYMNWIDSHRRIDEGVTVGNCRMNRWRFAGELVLHAWIFSTRIWSFFCCVRPKRNENQL